MTEAPRCAVREPAVRAVLERGWQKTARQVPGIARSLLSALGDALVRRPPDLEREVARIRRLYLPTSPKQGALLYLLARASRARRIVEFGTSFGLSTLHLAGAVRDNGGGIVIGSELEPGKVSAARRNLAEAGLAAWAEIRQGDALETLADPGGPVDLLFLDGFAPHYLPILECLEPHLRPGALVVADNVFTFHGPLRGYLARVRDPRNGFLSLPLFLKDGTELSLRL